MAKISSKIIEAHGRKLALALDWNTIPGVERQAEEIAALSKEVGATHYAKSKPGDTEVNTLVGFMSNDAITKGKIYSAAQSFASMHGIAEQAIFVWNIDDTDTWVCHVKDGYPVVGHDFVLPRSRAVSEVNDIVSFSDDKIVLYGNSDEYPSDSPLTIDDIAEACGKDDEIKKISSFNISPLTIILTLLVVSAAAAGGYYYMEQQRIAELRRQQAEAQKVDPNVQYQEALKSAQTGAPASARWASMKKSIEGLEVFANGWKFKKIECDFAAACTLTWDRVNGSNSDLISVLNLPADVKWETDGTKVTYSLPIPALTGKDKVDLDALPKMKDFFVTFMSDVQNASLIGLMTQVKSAEPFSLPPGVPVTDIKPDSIVSAGEWTVSGDYWLNEFIETMPKNFSLKTLRVEFQGDKISFEAKGNYYAKN